MQDNRPILSVAELNRQARLTIEERFNMVWVTGELSNFARPRSGHWYFTLKDESAQVRCAMFVNRNRFAKIQPSDGQQVVVRGRVSLYEGRGEFQIIVDQMEPAGEGALRRAFDALKLKLDEEGLFDVDGKRDLPRFPRHAAVISSATGAALQDVIAVWRRRYPALRVTLIPSDVQGAEAETQLLAALARLGELDPDVAIITRGGGSLEDLWAFNLESVVRAVSACHVPIVSAIGHEIDVTIVDFAADVRAPTPSAAAELTVPNAAELREVLGVYERDFVSAWRRSADVQTLTVNNLALRLTNPQTAIEQAYQRTDDALRRLQAASGRTISERESKLESLTRQLALLGPRNRIRIALTDLAQAGQRLTAALDRNVRARSERLQTLGRMLAGVSPLPTLGRGYALIRDAGSGDVVASIAQATQAQQVVAQLADGRFTATIDTVDNEGKLEDPIR